MANTKSIFTALRNGFSYLDSLGHKEENQFRYDTLNALRDFIYTGCYTSYKNKGIFLEYEDLKDEKLANKLGISVAGVRQARKRITNDAYCALGSNVIDTVLYGTSKMCDSVIKSITVLSYIYSTRTYMFNDVLDKIEDSYIGDGTETFQLNDCRKEILFLRLFTLQPFTELVDMLDSEKLYYIVQVLRNGADAKGTKLLVLKYLHSDDTDLALLFDDIKRNLFSKKSKSDSDSSKE